MNNMTLYPLREGTYLGAVLKMCIKCGKREVKHRADDYCSKCYEEEVKA